MTDRPRVGFLGLGQMGLPMARNLLKAGFPLVVHNRSRGRVEQMVSEGAEAAINPSDLVGRCDIVLTCLPKPVDVAHVYLDPDGLIAGARSGQILCDMSTIDAETHRRIAAAAAARGAGYLDAPVSGGTSGARDGTLSIMVGGAESDVARARPVFEAMGRDIYHVGPVGSGAIVKLVNQMMGAICHLGVVEGLVLGAKAGIDPALLIQIVSTSSGGSRALGSAPNVLRRDFAPGFTLDLMQKDVSLAVQLARELGVRTLAGALAEQVIGEARAAGLGGNANHALVVPLERLSGIEIHGR